MFKDKRYQEVIGVILILFSLLIFLSLVSFNPGDYASFTRHGAVKNIIGPLGVLLSHGLRYAFGSASLIITAMSVVAGWAIIKKGSMEHVLEKMFSLFFLLISVSALISLWGSDNQLLSGGFIGFYLFKFFQASLGGIGAYLVIAILNLIGLILLGIISLTALLEFAENKKIMSDIIKTIKSSLKEKKIKKNVPHVILDNTDETPAENRFQLPWVIKNITNKNNHIPWVIKKKIIIDDFIDSDTGSGDSLRYLEMSVPSAVNNPYARMRENYIDPFNDSARTPVSGAGIKNNEKISPSPIIEEDVEFDSLPVTTKPILPQDEAPFYDDDSSDIEDGLIEDTAIIYDDMPVSLSRDESQGIIKSNRIKFVVSDDENSADAEIIPPQKSTVKSGIKPEKKPVKFEEEDLSRSEKLVFSDIKLNKEYIIPTTFLSISTQQDSDSWMNEIKKNSILLVNTLADFSIESKVVNVNRGPVITLYELQIAPGIKVNRIVGLADDIAMALAAYRVRIVAPIPGKSAIGVEIPNRKRESVTLGDIIKSDLYHKKEGSLIVALGKDILGKPVMLDLKKLPHLLIAGATGSGKSVCVNSIITSLVYNYDPNYVRFILVDPKMVELQLYNGLPHLLTPVVTEPFVVPSILKWATYEMERRYRLLSELSTRDIDRYNEKIKTLGNRYERLPFIVTIIDELADLMMVASKDIEGYITRIAQKARAVGIHLVLATQRPSVDIITGVIKANFPARIAFQVAQKTDSRTIIDQNGAEKLLGKGDMLYQSPNSSYPVRIQGAYISEDEILKIVDHLSQFGEPNYIDIEESLFDAESQLGGDDDSDELFVEALKIVEETRKASASYLQRRLSIGYNRAARIIELMEDRGYIGPQQGSKPREVLI